MTPRRSAVVAVLLAAFVAVATSACGATAASAPRVATLETNTATPSPTHTAEDTSRPRERIDMTQEELTALQAPYLSCLEQHGLDLNDRGSPAFTAQDKQKANEACEKFAPLPPWEEDANNPQATDFVLKVVDCLRAKGVKYVEVSRSSEGDIVGPAFGGPQNDQQSITLGLQLMPECEKEVYTQARK